MAKGIYGHLTGKTEAEVEEIFPGLPELGSAWLEDMIAIAIYEVAEAKRAEEKARRRRGVIPRPRR